MALTHYHRGHQRGQQHTTYLGFQCIAFQNSRRRKGQAYAQRRWSGERDGFDLARVRDLEEHLRRR